MKTHTLQGSVRTITGRKVKTLRRGGNIPATVYGKKVESVNVTVSAEAFGRVYKEAGETGVVQFSIDKDTRPVLIHHVQKDPVEGTVLHVEFHQVDLKEKVKAKVPLELTGESPAVAEKKGVLLTLADEVEVEALPTDLPESITVDVTGLTDVDQEVRVSSLTAPAGVVILTDAEVAIVKVGALVSKEAEEQAAQEAAAAAESAETSEEEGGEKKEGTEDAKEEGGEKNDEKPADKPDAQEKS